MKRINRELTINLGTLKDYGSYRDKIVLPELDCYISLIVKKDEATYPTTNQHKLGSNS